MKVCAKHNKRKLLYRLQSAGIQLFLGALCPTDWKTSRPTPPEVTAKLIPLHPVPLGILINNLADFILFICLFIQCSQQNSPLAREPKSVHATRTLMREGWMKQRADLKG